MNELASCMMHSREGIVTRHDVRSVLGPFHFMPNYKVVYPEIVLRALERLYREYNEVFIPLVAANREWETDYRFCFDISDGLPSNFAVQIDMAGLDRSFLEEAPNMPFYEVLSIVRDQVFEIENSLAMYQLLERSFVGGDGDSFFKSRFRKSLNELRVRFQKPIALLAVTEQKYKSILAVEFGKREGESISDNEVKELSGFNRLFGPEDFLRHLEKNNGECGYLLYARTSDPVDKLKKPDTVIHHPLLGDSEIRRIIKENALTFNIDAPEMSFTRRINDTKEYMPLMGLGFQISSEADLFSFEFMEHLSADRPYHAFTGAKLSQKFANYLILRGINPFEAANGTMAFRFKPLKGAYGCYGHIIGSLDRKKRRSELRRNLAARGDYIVQPEKNIPVIADEYNFIDRNFFALTIGAPRFLGGFRSLMPLNSPEAKKGRNHGSSSTVLAEIRA